MVCKCLPLFTAFLLVGLTISAQEAPSLGEIARKLKAQKGDAHESAVQPVAPRPNTAPASSGNDSAATRQQPAPVAPSAVPATEAAILPDLNADTATDIRGMEKYQAAIRQMFLQEKFEEIDRLAAEARTTKARFPGGFWKLAVIYFPLTEPLAGNKASEAEWLQHKTLLEKWVKQRPNSVTPRVALGWFYNNYGWKARGSGFADTVSDEGWRLLAERENSGRKILEDAQSLPEKCPEWFRAMMSIAVAESWNSDQMNALFERAIAFEPDYFYYYQLRAESFLPKWGGQADDAARFAASMADRVGGKKGDMIYYFIGKRLNCACDNDRVLSGMSWPRLQRGYAAVEELYGTSITNTNAMAFMAGQARDFQFAVPLFARIGQNWDRLLWPLREDFEDARRRASDGLAMGHYREAVENTKTPEGQAYNSALTQTINQKYLHTLIECMKTPSVAVPKVGLLMQLAKDGTPRQILLVPLNAPSECFRPQIEKAVFSAPPRPDYWVAVTLDVKQ